jgi:hypothetical protein
MNQKEIDFIIGLLKDIKSSNLKKDSKEIQELWNNLFVYASQHINKEGKLGLLSSIDLNVQDLKHYLGIDVPMVIDYSFITNEKVRNQLEVDCLEMSKYRFGKGDKQIDFDEYCRFAIMQIELISNYFLNNFEVKSFMKKYNPDGLDRLKGQLNRAEDIMSLEIKIYAIRSYFNLDWWIFYTIQNMRKVRNAISHRSSFQLEEESKKLDRFLRKGLDGKSKQNITDHRDKKLFDEGKYIKFKKDKDWNKVVKVLNIFVNNIKKYLKTNESEEKTVDNYAHLKSL